MSHFTLTLDSASGSFTINTLEDLWDRVGYVPVEVICDLDDYFEEKEIV